MKPPSKEEALLMLQEIAEKIIEAKVVIGTHNAAAHAALKRAQQELTTARINVI